mgnify:CR=1 FL=1
MNRKIVITLINIAVGLLTTYAFFASDREAKISKTQSNIACEIIKLHLEHSSRQHPKADIVYQNKEYPQASRLAIVCKLDSMIARSFMMTCLIGSFVVIRV